MKPNLLLTIIFLSFSISTNAQQQNPAWASKVGAKAFASGNKIYTVKATTDTAKVITKAIQKTIDDCAAKGGGNVQFKPGTYVTGAVFIKSGVQLIIDKGVTILASQNFDDYPDIETRVAGIEMKWPAALINIIDAANAAVSGEGVVNARGKFCWDKYWAMRKEYDAKGLRWIVDYDVKRVRTILVQNSSDITLKGITLKNAGFWTVQLLYSHHLTVDGLVIKNNEDGSGPSTDGIDVDSSDWVLIQNCDIDCNDDNFCLKAGRDWDGLRVNRPTEYVVIKNCLARRGAGLVTLGSETSGGIRHVLATDLMARHTDNGLRIKSATTRGGTIEDIYFQNSLLDSVNNIFQFNLNWYPAYSYSTLPAGYTSENIPAHWKSMLQKVTPAEKGIPHAKNFYISNIRATNGQNAFVANGLEQSQLSNFVFSNCELSAVNMGTLEFTQNWQFKNLTYTAVKKQPESKGKPSNEPNERTKN
ncbi:MAG: right-handed parallel beta-helix repeat-containing protein [Aquabacterium sp.]|nr:right-handed parallel beta-helix repeat-containing protein [Ferruginibacter sp.]